MFGREWLRAVAQGYIYSYNKIELGSNFKKNVKNLGVILRWGFDGYSRLREVTITITITWN